MNDSDDDKTYTAATIARLLGLDPSVLTDYQRAFLAKLADQERRLARLEAILRREGRR